MAIQNIHYATPNTKQRVVKQAFGSEPFEPGPSRYVYHLKGSQHALQAPMPPSGYLIPQMVLFSRDVAHIMQPKMPSCRQAGSGSMAGML